MMKNRGLTPISTIAGHPRPGGGIELYAWLFMRISGLVLIFLALGHLVIMHMIHTVDHIDYQFVVGRYAGLFWRGYDLAMLLLALIHGANGIRYLIDDYTRPGKWRKISIRILYAVTGIFAVMGTWVIVAFQPNHSVQRTACLAARPLPAEKL